MESAHFRARLRPDYFLLSFAGIKLALHLVVNAMPGYGFFRDEFYYLACGNHLGWGYVDHPPFVGFVAALTTSLFGESLFAIRLLPAVAGAMVVYCTGLLAREMGGSRSAQGLAAFAVIAAPIFLGIDGFFSMNPFDHLFWVLALLLLVRILNGGSGREWVWFGIWFGLGLMNKHGMAFLILGVVAGLLISRERRLVFTRGFWMAAGIAAIIFLPNIIWEVVHGYPTLEWARNASAEKNIPLSPLGFLLGLIPEMNPFALPVFGAGLWYLFAAPPGRPYRALGWATATIFVLLVASHGKPYYFAPIFPLLFAAGSVWLAERAKAPQWHSAPYVFGFMIGVGMLVALPFTLPILPVETFIRYQAALGQQPRTDERHSMGALPQHYADMHGWPEMAQAVAAASEMLAPTERSRCAVFAQNYGEAGALEFFGRKYGLPPVISGHNSYWLWGPGKFDGEVLIILGGKIEDHRRSFENVVKVGETDNIYSMPYERHLGIFIARRLKVPVYEAWMGAKTYI